MTEPRSATALHEALGPRAGDAFGELLLAAYARHRDGTLLRDSMSEVVERSDGAVSTAPARFYLAPVGGWLECERRLVGRLRGEVLDVGCGAGRLGVHLRSLGAATEVSAVTGIDCSPGAVQVSRLRGTTAVCADLLEYRFTSEARYDTLALFGNNVGMLASAEHAPAVLEVLDALSRPGGRVVGTVVDPYWRPNPALEAYLERNRAANRLPGQLLVRERFRDLATPWFDTLWCSPKELDGLVAGSAWQVAEVERGDGPSYGVILSRRAGA